MQVIFLDDGGVMNDNALREPQWRQFVAEFFPPRPGGHPSRWSEANAITIKRQFSELFPLAATAPDYATWRREFDLF